MSILLDGQPLPAHEGEPIASALAAAGVEILGRSMKYHRPRGSSCGAGHCSHCLVRVDGRPNVRACITPVRDGMKVERQNVLGGAEHDLLGVTDWLFPRGLDHHEMFTGVPLVQPVVDKVVRKLSGFGTLPEAPVESGPVEDREVDVLVVGAGASGLAAARAARKAGATTLLVEASGNVGGRAATGLYPGGRAQEDARAAYEGGGGELWLQSAAIQVDREEGRLLVVVDRGDHLVQVWPGAVVFATGGYNALGLFENNDLPGVMHGTWVAALVSRWGVLPGERAVVCGDGPEAQRLTALLEGAGGRVVRTLPAAAALEGDTEPRLVAATGGKGVRGVVIRAGGREEEVPCDLLVLALPQAPAFELAMSAGASVAFEPGHGGFAVQADDAGRSGAPDVFVCGSLLGARPPAESAPTGRLAGAAAAEFATERRETHAP